MNFTMQAAICPADSMLQNLISGKVGELEEAELIEHVRHCDACRQRLSKHESDNSDSILEKLKTGDRSSAFQHEPDCQWATSLALGAIAGSNDEETHGDAFQLPMDLGDYRLIEPIAHGGMGVVYRAQHLRLGRDVAVKIISGKRLADKRAIQRFEAEMRTLGQLSHPNIVSALDARELGGQPVLIMEFVDGMDLSQIVQRLGPLPPESVAAIGRAIAAALEYADRNGLVHRDVKPSNIMVSLAGEVKLLDLGLARLQVTQSSELDGTITGLALGTADYMSPEQIHDARNVDVRSDLYSLGCTLYKLFTGAAPYSDLKHATNFSKLSAHVSPSPILIPNEFKIRSSKLALLIEKLTSKNREDRPQHAKDVSLALDELACETNLISLVQLARSAPSMKLETQSDFQGTNSETQSVGVGASNHRIRPWITTALGIAGLPIGVLFGIWLTIHRPNGETHRIEIPSSAKASVDANGDVSIELNSSQKQPVSPLVIDTNLFPTSEKSNSMEERELSIAMRAVSKATAPIYRGYSFDDWLNLFEKDRNIDIIVVAARALIHLSDSDEQKKRVAKAILERCRTWGGTDFGDGGNSPSPKWMKMFTEEFPKLIPEPGLPLIIAELNEGNAESRIACELILLLTAGKWIRSSEQTSARARIHPDQLNPLLEALASASVKNPYLNENANWQTNRSLNLMMSIANDAKLVLHEMPKVLQEKAKHEWESFAILPTSQVARYGSGHFTVPEPAIWLPYWKNLPAQQRNPLRILYLIFQDQANMSQNLDVDQLLSHIESINNEDKLKIKQFLVQRLADSDFDNYRELSNGIWPKILDWLAKLNVFSKDDSQAALEIVRKTEANIIEIVGPEIYSQIEPRRIGSGGMGGGGMGGMGGGGMGGMGGGLTSSIPKVLQISVEGQIDTGIDELTKLLRIEELDFPKKIRLPGDGINKQIGSGGMF